jgi:cytochrome P450
MPTATAKPPLKPGLPPHPAKEHWFFGNAFYLVNFPISFIEESMPSFDGIFLLTSRFLKMMIVNEPEYVKHIMQDNNKNYTKWLRNDVLELLLGNGLLTSEGDFWRRQRRLSQPAFHRERLALTADTMVNCTQKLVEKLEALPDKQGVDISKEMMGLTLDIVARAMFSTDVKEAVETVSREIEIASQLIIQRFKEPFRFPIWVPTPRNVKEKESVARLDAVLSSIIQARRKNTERFDDLLSMLMEAKDEDTGEQMSDAQLRDETMTIFLAGHETTAVALTWFWYLLDKNPIEAQKVYDEIDQVLQGRTPALADLHNLYYTKMAIDESLRLYPPAWITGRENMEEDEIGGYRIPKGYALLIPVYHIHRDPRIWKEPTKFMPERFTKENFKDIHRFAYFPFGGGPRQCIGNNFALMEMQLVIAMLVQKFRFKLSPGFEPELNPLVTLRTKNGMKMDVVARRK